MGKHGKYRTLVRLVWPLLFALAASPAGACRLALVLALDVSSSVDEQEDILQRQGLAAALIAPRVRAAFLASPDPVALNIFEWSGRYNQETLLDWVLISDEESLLYAAETIATSTRSHNDFPTALGYALGDAAIRLQNGPDCVSSTIDVSGDGTHNEGFGPAEAYDNFPFDGVTVNGLVIPTTSERAADELIDYYRNDVIRGPGAFIEIAVGFEDFERAMEAKLIRELSSQLIGMADAEITR